MDFSLPKSIFKVKKNLGFRYKNEKYKHLLIRKCRKTDVASNLKDQESSLLDSVPEDHHEFHGFSQSLFMETTCPWCQLTNSKRTAPTVVISQFGAVKM